MSRSDGEYALVWRSETCQIAFHVATLMPTSGPDAALNKKRHIGNDCVTVVFMDDDEGARSRAR